MTARLGATALAVVATMAAARADPARIMTAEAERTGATWRVTATLQHPDTGWGHYADGWRIETRQGEVLGTRELLHPHVDEQPFTRSLAGVKIPAEVGDLIIRARCNLTGWSNGTFPLSLATTR